MASATDMRTQLYEDGYMPGRPSTEAASIDAGVAAQSRCGECGQYGLDYEPFINLAIRTTGSGGYRALAVCPKCGAAQEF